MSKSHRDNHAARVKRGPVAFAKKFTRRHPKTVQCTICGHQCRRKLIEAGICQRCRTGAGVPA